MSHLKQLPGKTLIETQLEDLHVFEKPRPKKDTVLWYWFAGWRLPGKKTPVERYLGPSRQGKTLTREEALAKARSLKARDLGLSVGKPVIVRDKSELRNLMLIAIDEFKREYGKKKQYGLFLEDLFEERDVKNKDTKAILQVRWQDDNVFEYAFVEIFEDEVPYVIEIMREHGHLFHEDEDGEDHSSDGNLDSWKV